jgi:outer membrane protein OmpA-like peptidoglycan-associated protein
LRDASRQNLTKLAVILDKYPDTNVLIEGHTDSTGTEEHNLTLSKQRADAVAFYLAEQNVSSRRFSVMGYGETQPIATNDSADGRQMNRRVDIAVMANDKLKKAAQENTKGL